MLFRCINSLAKKTFKFLHFHQVHVYYIFITNSILFVKLTILFTFCFVPDKWFTSLDQMNRVFCLSKYFMICFKSIAIRLWWKQNSGCRQASRQTCFNDIAYFWLIHFKCVSNSILMKLLFFRCIFSAVLVG